MKKELSFTEFCRRGGKAGRGKSKKRKRNTLAVAAILARSKGWMKPDWKENPPSQSEFITEFIDWWTRKYQIPVPRIALMINLYKRKF